MTSIRDVQSYLGINAITFSLMQDHRFPSSIRTAVTDKTGTKVIILRRLPHVHYLTELEQSPEDAQRVEAVMYDVKTDAHVMTLNSKRVHSLTIQYKNLRIDPNSSFFAHAGIFVDGDKVMQKFLVPFDDLAEIPEKQPAADKWINSIKLPPPTTKFVKVRSSGNFTMALSTAGELWTRGWTDDGLFTESEEFTVLPRFKTEDGKYQTSLGRSKVVDFVFDAIHVIILFENGAVQVFGCIAEFAGYADDVPSDGFYEITNSEKVKPAFFDKVAGGMDSSPGKYGIFGNHRVVKYFRHMYAFLTDEGVPIIRYVKEVDNKNTYWYTPLDIHKYFAGEKIVNMNHHVRDMYMTASGKIYVFYPDRLTEELVVALQTPLYTRNLGFDVNRLKYSLLSRHDSLTIFRDDGKFFTLDMQDPNAEPLDVTERITSYTKDPQTGKDMIIKWYSQPNLSACFLCE